MFSKGQDMKKLAFIGLLTVASPALADSVNATIEDHYKTMTRQIPSTERICRTVDVPVYGQVQGQASTGDVLAGAIIGGVLGNQVGGGSGKDAATVLGAIVGADVANKNGSTREEITGYRREERCENRTTYTSQTESIYSHSTITWYENGRRVSLEFQR